MAAQDLSDAQIESRLSMIEAKIAHAPVKDLPALNRIFSALIDEQVRRDLAKQGKPQKESATKC